MQRWNVDQAARYRGRAPGAGRLGSGEESGDEDRNGTLTTDNHRFLLITKSRPTKDETPQVSSRGSSGSLGPGMYPPQRVDTNHASRVPQAISPCSPVGERQLMPTSRQ